MSTQTPKNKNDSAIGSGRIARLGLVIVCAGAIAGFFLGLQSGLPDSSSKQNHHPPTQHGTTRVVPATHWADINQANLGPNAGWQTHLGMAASSHAAETSTEAERQIARQRRMQNRAFDGAPPTIPHQIDGMHVAACVQCHGEGLMIGGSIRAPQMSHPTYASCTQCHVPQNSATPENTLVTDADGNSFSGLIIPENGARAHPLAPPTIPHRTHMRENCMSCHGPTGRNAIRTSHPYRQSCTQCHAPNATFNLTPTSNEAPLLLSGESAIPEP